MAASEYHFVTRWRVEAAIEEIQEILNEAEDLARWWPSVYLDVRIEEPGDPGTAIGRVVSLYTKGWLPYTLRWKFRLTENRFPHGFSLEAMGDFVGRGVWTLKQDGPIADITYDWRISAEKPLLKYLSFMMKPLFSANHVWAMARGEESLRLELARRHAKSDDERAGLAAPPPPTFRWSIKK